MKKIYLVFFLVFIGIASYSQNVEIGIRIGGNQSKLNGDYGIKSDYDYTDYVSVSKFHYGFFFNYYLLKNLYIQSGINYKTKGFEYHTKDGIDGGYWRGNTDFNYLEIPVLINYSYGNKLKIFANCGPSINILISGGEYYYSTWGSHDLNNVTNYYSRNIKSDFHDITIGMNVGLGIQHEISRIIVLFSEFRVSYDVTESTYKKEVIDENTGNIWYYNNPSFLDLSLDFGVLYRFGE